MGWARVLRGVSCLAVAACLLGEARADDSPAAPARRFDDTGRIYLFFESGMNFTLDRHFAGDVRVVPQSAVEFNLGGGVGYNIDPHWGVELQVNGIDPWIRSENRGAIDSFSNQGLAQLGPTLAQMRQVLRQINRLTSQLQENPTGYLLGRTKPQEFQPK